MDSTLNSTFDGTKPRDGSDPKVFSNTIPFAPLSFLRINLSNAIPPTETKYFPSVLAPTYLKDEALYYHNFTKKEDVFKGNHIMIDPGFGGV